MEHPSLIINPIPDAQILTLINHLLRRHHRHLAIPRNGLGRLQTALHQLLPARKRPSRNTPLPSLLPREALPRENQLHGPRLPNRFRQSLAAPGSRYRTQLDFRLPEIRRLGTVQYVAHQCQFTTAAESVAGHGGDDRLLDGGGERGPGLYEGGCVGFGEGEGRHFFNVGACCEGFLRAGEEDGADGGGLVEGDEGLV